MATDMEYAIKRMRNIVIKSRAKMKNNLALALMELPSANQIRRLKKAANEMDKVHKVVMRLAAARESAGEKIGRKKSRKKPIKRGRNLDARRINVKNTAGLLSAVSGERSGAKTEKHSSFLSLDESQMTKKFIKSVKKMERQEREARSQYKPVLFRI